MRPEPKITFSVNMPIGLRERLVKYVDSKDVSVSAFIRDLVEIKLKMEGF